MASVLNNMPLPTSIKFATPRNDTAPTVADSVLEIVQSIETELCKQHLEFDFGYDTDLSDDSSVTSYMHSPVTTPTATLNTKTVASSPCAVDDMAFATSSCTWSSESSRPARRKRARMSEEERKVRHREVQREFMKRKRARIAVLRKEQVGVEKQLRLVRVMLEVAMLKKEQQSLTEQYEMCERAKWTSSSSASVDVTPESVRAFKFDGLSFSVPSEEIVADDYMMMHEDWTELYDMVSLSTNHQSDIGLLDIEEVAIPDV